jgi:MFS family permease
MEQTKTKLWNKNFTMLAIGQIISLFANGILRFALPLHIFLISGSAELMGRVLALSLIPMAILSPIGGALADRLKKKIVIVFLDFLTAIIVLLYLWTLGSLSIIPITTVALILFSSIKAVMSSTTEASVPLIVPTDELVGANSVITIINSLSMLLAPALGGVLLAGFGLEVILIVSGICLVLAAIMELFIKIPNVKQKSSGNMVKDIMKDIGDGLHFAIKQKSIIAKILLVFAASQFIAASVVGIGAPVLILQNLGMDERMLGLSQGLSAIGGLGGGILAGVLGQKLKIQQSYWTLIALALCIFSLGLVFFLPIHQLLAYIIITTSLFVVVGALTIFSIQVTVFVQHSTPAELLGKMMGLIMLAALMAIPLGSWLFGFLFDYFGENPWIIFFPAALLTIIVSLWTMIYFKGNTKIY